MESYVRVTQGMFGKISRFLEDEVSQNFVGNLSDFCVCQWVLRRLQGYGIEV